MRRSDANAHAVEDSTGDQHLIAVAGYLNSRANKPEKASKHIRVSSSDPCWRWDQQQWTQHKTGRQRGSNSSLANPMKFIEKVDVLLGANDGGHGGDVEAKPRKDQFDAA